MGVLRWHYGPTTEDPDPGKMWHYECGGEVWSFKEGMICRRCGASQDHDEDDRPEWAPTVRV